jgi:hypothetical protein
MEEWRYSYMHQMDLNGLVTFPWKMSPPYPFDRRVDEDPTSQLYFERISRIRVAQSV